MGIIIVIFLVRVLWVLLIAGTTGLKDDEDEEDAAAANEPVGGNVLIDNAPTRRCCII
jgi:hypothetical protein